MAFHRPATSGRREGGTGRSGELVPGDQLPSTAQLKAQHGVSSTVVRQAVLVLQAQGWVQGVHGLGVFVAER